MLQNYTFPKLARDANINIAASQQCKALLHIPRNVADFLQTNFPTGEDLTSSDFFLSGCINSLELVEGLNIPFGSITKNPEKALRRSFMFALKNIHFHFALENSYLSTKHSNPVLKLRPISIFRMEKLGKSDRAHLTAHRGL